MLIYSRLASHSGLWAQVFGNGADGADLCFCFGQRREFIKAKISDPSELLSVRTCFLVGRSGFGYRLGQAKIRGIVLFCFVVLKQPGGRRCNSEDVFILIE